MVRVRFSELTTFDSNNRKKPLFIVLSGRFQKEATFEKNKKNQ